MDIQPYHILLISPSSQQYHRIEQLLRGSQICQFRLHWFQGSELANVSENNKHYHAYLLDTTLEKAVFFSEQISPIPVIFITDDPLSGIEAVKQGVRDYLMFQELTIVALERSLRLSITHYQTQLKLERNQQDSLWEKQFYELAESVPVGLYRNDVNGNCIYINQECCKILDITLEECLGTGWLSRLHPDDKERVWQSWYQCFLTKSPWQDEYRFRHHNGKIVWVYAQAVFEFNDQGENTGSVGSLTDITERKKLEAKLSENEQFLQDIVSNIPDAIFRYVLHHDGSDQVVYISQGCQKLWEVKAEEVAENTQILWEMIHPDDVPEMQESVFISAQTLKDWDWQWRIITPSGKEKWLQGAGKPQGLENGDVVWTTVIVDVSDRKLSELALYESEQRFRAIFEQAAVGIVILSIDGILQKVNQTFCNFLGYESSELIGQHFSIFTHPDDIGSCDQSLQELIEDKQKNFIVKKRYFRSNGEIKWVESTVSLVRKNTKKPDYLIAIVQDIDSRVKTQHKLNYRLELETVVAKISKQLVTKNFINLQIILGQLGDIFNASRVCIHRFSQNQTKVSLFVEWCNQGVVSNMTEMQDIDTELFPWWMKQMFDKQRIIIHDIEEFPEEAIAEKQYFQNLDIKTVISVPIVDHSGELWGFIGFDRMDKTTPLSNNEAEVDTHVLRMLGEIIYVYLARIKSQQDLQESESRYRGIIEDQTELICRFSPQGILTFVNDAYCRFFNIKRQDLISRYFSSVMESIDKKDMVRTLHQCQKLTPDNPVVIKETKVKVKEKIYWLQWTTRAFFRTNGDITEFQALGQDITERKEAEQLLKESEANFRGIFEQAAIGIALVNHNGNFLSVNQHFCHFLRYSSSELLNLNFRSITFPDDLDISHQYIKKVMEEDAENYSLDKRYVAKNGE
ncbi:MAG: PAS domain S-box protein, partial [Crocosphaera sp.]